MIPPGPGVVERNAQRTRDELVAAAVGLLVRGEEPTMRAVAAAAGVGERTIYRYFPSREELEAAVRAQMAPRLSAPLCATVDGLEDYVDRLYATFEANAELTVATVSSSVAQAELKGTRARNLKDLTALLRAGFPQASASDVRAAAGSLRTVLSGAGWVFQRHGCGLTAEEVRTNAIWLVRKVRAALAG